MEPNDILTGIWMRRIEEAYQTSTDPLLVRVHRYSAPHDAFGWHLLMFYSDVEPFNPLRMTTLGLCTPEIDKSILEATALMGLIDLSDLEHHTLSPLVANPKLNYSLRDYLIGQIAPSEWQAPMHAGDRELLSRLQVFSTESAQRPGGRWAIPAIAH